MEDVLAVYTRPRDGDCPLVCLDETSKQLIAETRVPISMKAGRPARFDYEYERNGTANLFMMFAPLEGWRHVKVTDRHTAVDYARVLKDLADIHFAHAKTIVLVQDNLSIHSKASLYEAFPAVEARRLVERFEWHYTPKHGSWLDLAESELGVLTSQRVCVGASRATLIMLPGTIFLGLRFGISGQKGAAGMSSKAGGYRRRARECLEIAGTFRDGRRRSILLQMAQVWQRLAAEQDYIPDLAEAPARPPATPQIRPVAQKQQPDSAQPKQ